jgi:hypothetical protein
LVAGDRTVWLEAPSAAKVRKDLFCGAHAHEASGRSGNLDEWDIGGVLDRALVGVPAWRAFGAQAWLEFSRRAHLA